MHKVIFIKRILGTRTELRKEFKIDFVPFAKLTFKDIDFMECIDYIVYDNINKVFLLYTKSDSGLYSGSDNQFDSGKTEEEIKNKYIEKGWYARIWY